MENSFSYQPAAGRYERMPYKYCGKSGLQLPLISLGLWHNFGSVDNFDVATDMIKYAFDHGVTHFDLANNYGPLPGSAETNFGRILRENFQGYRDEMIISSNAGHDLSLVNLNYLYQNIPWMDEVSIGHSLISDALYLGLERTIQEYKNCLR